MNLKILLVTPASPFNPRSGAQQRSALLLEALQLLGTVQVVIISPGPETKICPNQTTVECPSITWKALPFGIAKYKADTNLNQQLVEVLAEPLSNFDLIVGRYLNPISKLVIPANIPTIVDLDDFGYSYAGNRSILNAFKHLKSWYVFQLARSTLSRFSAFFFVSELNQRAFKHVPSRVLPNIPYAFPALANDHAEGNTILFVGSLWYPPNRDGIDWFIQKCWPDILSAVPQAKLLLVGAAPHSILTKWEQTQGVRAPGFVENLSATYRDCAFCIAPVHYGGGTNIKILESFAHMRACVTTLHCAAPFSEDLVSHGCLSVAANDVQFTKQCIALLRTRHKRDAEARIGHDIVTRHYTRSRFNRVVSDLVSTQFPTTSALRSSPLVNEDSIAPVWAIGVFAHNESDNIEKCLASILAATQTPESLQIVVLNNGSTDNTAARVEGYAATHPNILHVTIKTGDKANAWNLFVHEISGEADIYGFVDGDVTISSLALDMLAATLIQNPHAHMATAVPFSGRHKHEQVQMLDTLSGVQGNLYAARSSFIRDIRRENIRMPVGFVREDGLVGAFAMYDLDPFKNYWDTTRVIPVKTAGFYFKPMQWWSIKNIKQYLRRRIRYSIGHFENLLVRDLIHMKGFSEIPEDVTALYRSAVLPTLMWRGFNTLFDAIALKRIKQKILPPQA